MAKINKLHELEGLLEDAVEKHGIDWGIKCDTANECAWGIEVRITRHPNVPSRPDDSRVLFAGGFSGPEEAAAALVQPVVDLLRELCESPS